jgi:hypothetical protein
MAVRQRPRKLGLRRAGSLVRPAHGCASSVCARRGSGRAQAAMGMDGAKSSPRRRQWRTAELGSGARAREARGRAGFIPAGGRLGASGVTLVTHARVEGSQHGRRCASRRRPMARHGRCAGRWISATWRSPLATAVTGELPPSQHSDRWSLRCLGVHARRGYGAYGGLPTWPHAMSRQSALRRSRAISIR